jgi:predicted RNA-binding protein (virulence factor B family)
MIQLGKINTLKINRQTDNGFYLVDERGSEVLLPNAFITPEMKIGKEIEVFIYHDSEDRLIATTQKPLAKLDEFGFFEVVDVTHFGAFVSWGLAKDLLVPKKFQKEPFRIGEKKFLRVVYDEKTHRLVATQKFGKYLNYEPKGYTINKEVKALIIKQTDLGYKCIVDDTYEGLLYKNEVFEDIKVGEIKKAYVKKRRHDGKLDLSLKKIGAKATKDSQAKVLKLLKEHNGMLPYSYKSSPEEIKEFFGLSKKEFKRVLTKLQEAKKIEITNQAISIC